MALVARMLAGMTLDRDRTYAIHIHLHGQWIRNGKPVRKDAINFAKVAEDAVMRALGVDDSWNFRVVIDKRESADPHVIVVVRELARLPAYPPLPPLGL